VAVDGQRLTNGREGDTALVVEDEASIQSLVRLYLEQAGFRVVAARDGQTGLDLHAREHPVLVVLDVMLPVVDGLEVCRRIRQNSSTPILMLTARRTEDDRVAGLDLGADDYLTKPFSPREFMARVRAIMRRAAPPSAAGASAELEHISFEGLTIIPGAHRVEVDGHSVDLTAKEFALLLAFARAPDHVLSRETLLSQVWGFDYLGDSRTVDVHIGTLRKKIERDSTHPRYIKTVWRVGYKLDPLGAAEEMTSESESGRRE
jgi:two-component system, OmpR family, response regulator ResD